MKYLVDPKQKPLFDPFASVFSELAYQHVRQGWQGVFRHVILELLPAEEIGRHFSSDLGRPTKELYSMAGLLLIMEFKNWTRAEAVEAYMFHADVQYALNLEPGLQSLSERTLERYEQIFREDDSPAEVMHRVTLRLAEVLEINVSQQRLDSTHVFSNMATFGRTRLMGVAVKRFLTQVKRHAPAAYQALPEELRRRYAPSEHQLFADAKDAERRSRQRQQVAEDLYFLVELFGNDAGMAKRSSYQSLVLIFQQQCVVEDGQIKIQTKPGGRTMQNPSDPDATYDGKKGQGYQVQLTETCHPDNEVQLITSALPQTAADSDALAVQPVLAELVKNDLLPDEMLADTAYGSDENVRAAADLGVELVSPVSGPKSDSTALNADDFAVDETTRQVVCCPAGETPMRSEYDAETQTTTVLMPASACGGCPFRGACPVKEVTGGCQLRFTDKERRLEERRREEATDVFRERYAARAGIESTNSGLKNRLGMGDLRVRGSPSVFQALLLKIAGWNVLRSAAAQKMRAWVAQKMAEMGRGGVFSHIFGLFRRQTASASVPVGFFGSRMSDPDANCCCQAA